MVVRKRLGDNQLSKGLNTRMMVFLTESTGESTDFIVLSADKLDRCSLLTVHTPKEKVYRYWS
jgi:hypothetical protein